MWAGAISPYSSDVLTAAINDELVESGKFLAAFLLARSELPAEEAWLPVELQHVLQLPQTPRLCFVLRVLEAWPRERCAKALGIPAERVDAEACGAAQRLARLAGRNTSIGWCDGQTLEATKIPPNE